MKTPVPPRQFRTAPPDLLEFFAFNNIPWGVLLTPPQPVTPGYDRGHPANMEPYPAGLATACRAPSRLPTKQPR
jgi:hypothetical protein